MINEGLLKDDSKTIEELGIKDGTKIMLIGSSIGDVLNAAAPSAETVASIAKEGQALLTSRLFI